MKDEKMRKKITDKKILAVIAMICLIAVVCVCIVCAADTGSTDDTIRKLQNGSFEEEQSWTSNYSQLDQSKVPSWNTTAFQGKIELFKENTGVYIKNVKLAPTDGSYAAELNADEESTLYQNVQTTPSSVYEWGLDHGGRNGTDTMALVIGPKQSVDPSKPSKEGRDQLMQMVDWLIDQGMTSVKTSAGLGENLIVYSKKFAENGTFADNAGNDAFSLTPSTIYTEKWNIWIMASSMTSSGTNPWNSYGSNAEDPAESGDGSGGTEVDLNKYYFYTVPAGQTNTLFGFVSVGYVDSIASADKAKTYGNFLDNINFQLFHPLSGSTTNHGSAVVGGSDGTAEGEGASDGHQVTVDNKLATYITDGETLKIQAIIKAQDLEDGCQFVGVYYTKQDDNGNPVAEFIKVTGNEIEDTGSLTDEEKKGKWVKSTNADGDTVYTYYLENLTSATDLHFIFIKNPTVTYDPNGGKAYIIEDRPHQDEDENVYSFKPFKDSVDENSFVPPYVSKAAEGQNDGWKFCGWKLMGDIVNNVPSETELVNADELGSLLLPAEHTIACDYNVDGATDEKAAQYFKIYGGNVELTKSVSTKSEELVSGVTWNDNGETKLYANVHKGITMVAQWRWRQAFIPQVGQGGEYTNSTDGGTVEITSVTNTSDENYNDEYNADGGKSYHAATDERITVKAIAKDGCKFIGWYDEKGNLITTNAEYGYVETKESVNTYYARFSNTVTQTYIRQVENGDSWEDITDDTIGTLERYSYTDVIGMPISTTAAAGNGYKFVGWYDSEGNKVSDDMLVNSGATISYITTGDATYYARFSNRVTQTYIRQIKNGGSWEDTTDDTIGTLERYSYTDVIGMPISTTAAAGNGYKFVGWYDSDGNKVTDDMLINSGTTISYTITDDATYYARFETAYTLYVSKLDGDQSTAENKVPLVGVEFTLYQKDDGGDETIVCNGESIKCTLLCSEITALTEDSTKAIAVFTDELTSGTEFYLAETKTLTGYRLLDAPIKITINDSGETAYAEINGINKEITAKEVNIELANYLTLHMPTSGFSITGGSFAAAGLILLSAAAIGLFGYKASKLKRKSKIN